MSQNDEFSQSRANELWRRFIGMFGGEAVRRKYGPSVPPEWVAVLAKINAVQLERGMRRLVHSGRDAVPSLPAFVRLCCAVGSDDFDEGQSSVPALAAPDPWEGREWEMLANRYLHSHITRELAKDPKKYGRPASMAVMKLKKSGANADASPEFIANVGRLVAAKNAWVADMMDCAVEGSVPVELQQSVWKDYIDRAEAEIVRARMQAAA